MLGENGLADSIRAPWYNINPFAGYGFGSRDAYLVVAPRPLLAGGQGAPIGSGTPALRSGPFIDRFEHVVRRCFQHHLGPQFREAAGPLLTPYNLSLMAAFLAAFALAEGTPVGIVLTGAALAMLGVEAWRILDDFRTFIVKIGFPDKPGDVDAAAQSLAKYPRRLPGFDD